MWGGQSWLPPLQRAFGTGVRARKPPEGEVGRSPLTTVRGSESGLDCLLALEAVAGGEF
jgi:hypothetical protein